MGVMNLFRKPHRDRIESIQETRAGGATFQLITRDRGAREFTVSLSIDEIEDLIKTEDERRKNVGAGE